MPNTNWSDLNILQLGRYAEYYAKMEFASYGFEVYTSEVDDHGIDFIAKTRNGSFFEIQVKSVLKSKYVLLGKDKWNIDNPNVYLALLLFQDGSMPETYLIPATAWRYPNALLRDRDYIGFKSKPEYGLNISRKNMHLLEAYKFEEILMKIVDEEINNRD